MASASWFQPSPAPGRAGTSAPPTRPEEGQPAPASGPEATPPAPFGGAFTFLILALPLLLIFMMTRNQNKKQKQLESTLKSGDRVLTQSGISGRIIDISPNSTRVKLEIAPGVNIQILKSAIQGVDGGETTADAKAGDKAKESAKDKPQDKKS